MQLIAGLGNDTDDRKQQLIDQYERMNQEQHQTIEGLKSKYNAQAKQMEETANAKNELMCEISQLKEKWSKTEREQHQTIEGLKSKYNAQAKQMEETANAKNELMCEISQLKEKWSKTEREQNEDAADAFMPQDLIDH
eukprot:341084_1